MTLARVGLFNSSAEMAPQALLVERVASRRRECGAAVGLSELLVSSTVIFSLPNTIDVAGAREERRGSVGSFLSAIHGETL